MGDTIDRPALRKLIARATPLPWPEEVRGVLSALHYSPDGILITAAVNALPGLLDALDAVEKDRDEYRTRWETLDADRDRWVREVRDISLQWQAVARTERERAEAVRASAASLADRVLDLFPTDTEESYGAFPGGDPREFKPDEDCSTEAERAAHKAACDAWERGDQIEIPGGCEERDVEPGTERAVADEAIRNGAAAATASPGHVRISWQTFGLGTYVYRDETIQGARTDALAVRAVLDAKAGS